MITVMCFGMAAFLVLLVTGTTLPVLTIATIGLGLCMSGMYGTTVANAGDLFSRYPASMGIYVTLNGFGAAMAPAAIGIAANRTGIRWGFAILLIAGVLLVVSAVLNARYFKDRQHNKAVSAPKKHKTSLKRFREVLFYSLPFRLLLDSLPCSSCGKVCLQPT